MRIILTLVALLVAATVANIYWDEVKVISPAVSKSSKPSYTMRCRTPDNSLHTTHISYFRTGSSGFRIYYMDGTSEWFSNGNACTILDYKEQK